MSSSTGNYLEISVTALHIIFFALAVHTVTTGLSDCHSSLNFMLIGCSTFNASHFILMAFDLVWFHAITRRAQRGVPWFHCFQHFKTKLVVIYAETHTITPRCIWP